MEDSSEKQWVFSRADTLLQDALEEIKNQRDEFERMTNEAQEKMRSGSREFPAAAGAAIAIILGIAALEEQYRFMLQFLLYPIMFGVVLYFSFILGERYRQKRYDKVFEAFEQSIGMLLHAKKELTRASMNKSYPMNLSAIILDCCEASIAAAKIPLWRSLKSLSKAVFDSDDIRKYCVRSRKSLGDAINEGFEKRSGILSQVEDHTYIDSILKHSVELDQAHSDLQEKKASRWWKKDAASPASAPMAEEKVV